MKRWLLLLLLACNVLVLLYQAWWYLPPVDLDGRSGLSHRGRASAFPGESAD